MTTLQTLANFLVIPFLLWTNTASAQLTPNDDCSNAITIQNPTSFCSNADAGNNLFATPSNVPNPSCGTAARDVWYCFTAVATKAVIVINGNSFTNPGGTLFNPWVALYSGTCGNLTQLACKANNNLDNIVELRVENLVPGQKYFIRVDGDLFPGTFQYCIQNYFSSGATSGDCPTAVVLCDKTPFNVTAVTGNGNNPNELDDAPCFQGFNNEMQSTWYVWTAANTGTLNFTITPNNPGDDLDFVVYRLPNGVGNCSGKIVERCMAASCPGNTGLASTSNDTSEPPGCDPPSDGFVKTLNMTAGTSYALAINNFTESGSGFRLEFEGSGNFVGPQATFTNSEPDGKMCLGDSITFTNTSTFPNGSISKWVWNFGEGAVPQNANTAGPHKVTYATEGPKTATLTITSATGCEVTTSLVVVTVEQCCNAQISVSTAAGCPGDDGGTATVSITNATDPITINWSNGQTGATATGLPTGEHSITAMDANGCLDTVITFAINNIDYSVAASNDTTILKGSEIQLTANATLPGVIFVWSGGSIANDTTKTIKVSPTDTTVYVVKALIGGCTVTDTVRVNVIEKKFEVPNIFSPNGDNTNDKFFAIALGVTVREFKVWSRWGELVWNSNTAGWDGTINGNPAPSDIYVYRCVARDPGGEELVKKGDVLLMR